MSAQRGVEVEHVVQDGGSTDETETLLQRAPQHVRWSSEPDRGQSDALNKALRRASGEWIAWLNADEFYLPGALSALLAGAQSERSDIVYADTLFVDERGLMMRLMSHHPFRPVYLRWYGCYFASCSTLFKREVLEEDPFDREYGLAMDWDLFLRLHRAGRRFHYLRYPAGAFRMHGAQVIAHEEDHQRDFDRLETAHGVRPAGVRKIVRWIHDVDKLLHGAYRPQVRSRPYIGRDMRWFVSSSAEDDVRDFQTKCYGIR